MRSYGPSHGALDRTLAAGPQPPSAHADTRLRAWPHGTARGLAPSLRRWQNTPLAPIPAGTATHRVLAQCQAMHVARPWASAPASGPASVDGVVVVVQSLRQALHEARRGSPPPVPARPPAAQPAARAPAGQRPGPIPGAHVDARRRRPPPGHRRGLPKHTWSRMIARGVNVKHLKRFRFSGRTPCKATHRH